MVSKVEKRPRAALHVVKEVAEFLLLCFQVGLVCLGGGDDYRKALYYGEAVAFEALVFARIVAEKPQPVRAEVHEYLRADAVECARTSPLYSKRFDYNFFLSIYE